MKRIVYIINLYPPYVVGGNEILAHEVINALRARGYDIHVLTARGPQLDGLPQVYQALNYSLEDKVGLFQGGRVLSPAELFRHHVFDLVTYRNVRRLVRELQPHLIVLGNLFMASAAPFLAVRGAGCPVVAQVADRWVIYLLRDLGLLLHTDRRLLQGLVRPYVRLVQPVLWRLGRPDALFTISAFIKQVYVDASFPAGCIVPTHLGVDTALYRPRSEPHAGDNYLEVVFAGQLWEGKGPQVLIEALELLRQREPDLVLKLRLIGEGSESFKEYLRNHLRQHGMEDRTVLDGFVPAELLAERLRGGDIFVFPSVWDEPFSITLVAAMASGIPVVATRTGGTPEAFEDEVEGILVPPRDAEALAGAILQLARDPVLRNRLSQAGVLCARRRWSFDAYVDRMEQQYLAAMEKGGVTG
jgi:glycosyltransferase involved in cell wall biosynthesis